MTAWPSVRSAVSQIRISARYKGDPNLMGYRHGRVYTGWLKGNTFHPDDADCKPCPYTAAGFLRVWKDIEIREERAPT